MELLLTIFLFAIGLGLVLMAMYVEARHKQIWDSYKKTYKPKSNAFRNAISAPHKMVYQFNVYILWPLAFVLGLAAMVSAVMAWLS